MIDSGLFAGQQVDQFKVLEHIGRGGMADVYLAHDMALDRRVVLKLLLSELASSDELAIRFQREAQATARLAHPHIVQIYSVGETQKGLPYLALQYIEGGSLNQYLQNLARQDRWVSTTYAVTVARQMAGALAAAHEAGIVHRDLKPSNILLREERSAVLSDLGIAAVQQETTRLTRTGGILGTPHYMSPEQALGRQVDARSDLYSLGIILYELLAKRPPFEADSPLAVVHQQVYEQPLPLERVRPGLAKATVSVVRTCLQKDPAARYQTAAQLARALDEALQQEGVSDSTAPTVVETSALAIETQLYRQPLEPGSGLSVKHLMVIALVLASVLLGAGFFARNWLTEAREDESGEIAIVPSELPPTAEATLPPTPGQTTTTAATAQPTHTVTASPELTGTPSPQPENTLAPTAETDSANPLPGSGLVRMTSGNSGEWTPFLSPDQRTLLFQSDIAGNWQIFAVDTQGSEWQLLTDNSASNFHPHFSPDGSMIAFASNMDGNYEIYTMLSNGQGLRRLTDTTFADEYPSFSPDGEWILYLSKRDQGWGVYTMRTDGSDDRVIIDTESDETYPVFSPDGASIVFQSNQSGNHDIFTLPVNGGTPRQITTSTARDANPVYSPDGQWIAFESDRRGNYEVYAVRPDGTGLYNVTNHSATDQLPAFSPDGQWLLFQSDRSGSVDIYRQPFEP